MFPWGPWAWAGGMLVCGGVQPRAPPEGKAVELELPVEPSHLRVHVSSWYPHTAGHVAGTQDSSVQAAQTWSLPRAALDIPCVLQVMSCSSRAVFRGRD